MHFTGIHRQVDALQDLVATHIHVQVFNFQQTHSIPLVKLMKIFLMTSLRLARTTYPTLPSKLTLSSFCASTANPIGSSRNTRLQKPFTIIDTASSAFNPRCRR